MLVRRGVSIVGGELVRVSAPQGTFVRGRDGTWKRVGEHRARLETESRWAARHGIAAGARLGVGADGQVRQDKHLPAIASMLDEKQYALIARETAGLVAIQGSAGSGKTTVGLHRVAYLAFAEPQRFQPERDARGGAQRGAHPLRGARPPVAGGRGRAGDDVRALRGAARGADVSEAADPGERRDAAGGVAGQVARGDAAWDRAAGGARRSRRWTPACAPRWASGPREIAWSRAWEATGADDATPPDTRLSLLASWLAGKRQLPGVAPAASLPDVTRSALEQLGAQLRHETRGVAGLWDELLTSREALAETFEGVPGFGPGQLEQVHAWCVRQTRVRSEGERDGEEPHIDAEDRALLLRCWQVLRGPIVDAEGKPMRFAHAFVDEVQDASPVELRILLELTGKERCITLAGDVAQRMLDEGDDRGEFDWNALLDGLGVPHTKIEPLKVSYRSTAEITEFARAILGPAGARRRPGHDAPGPAGGALQLRVAGRGGGMAGGGAEAARARRAGRQRGARGAGFRSRPRSTSRGSSAPRCPTCAAWRSRTSPGTPGVDVTDVRQTKGLEFDEVVLLETTAASYPVTPPARHALYVGATRASHQLWCVASDEPSKLVSDALGPAAEAAS